MKIYISVILVSLGLLVEGQIIDLETNYNPIEFQGKIPAEFLKDAVDVSEKELAKNKQLSKSSAQTFYVNSNFVLNQFMNSGFVYFNDPLSEMVDKVGQEIIAKIEDDGLKDVRFFVTKFDVPNAFCWRNGYIFVNIGLIRELENEAQLAYILCHEIVHFQEQHSLNYYKETLSLSSLSKSERKKRKQKLKEDKSISDYINTDVDKIARDLKFSRSQETEADLKGLELYQLTKYDIQEAVGALKVLREFSKGVNYFIPSDLFSFFNNEEYQIDTNIIFEKGLQDTIYFNFEEEEKDILEENSTHPDINKRILAIEEAIKGFENTDGEKFIFFEKEWEAFKSLVAFELVEFYNEIGAYDKEYYASFKLLEKYPDNKYLGISNSRALFWMAVYKDAGSLKSSRFQYVYSDFHYTMNFIVKVLEKKNFVPSQLDSMQKKFPNLKEIQVYKLRYDEFVKNKKNSKSYKKVSGDDSDFDNFIKNKI